MSFELYLKEHLKRYTQITPQDVVKFCYQAANGAEHLLENPEAARILFDTEYGQVPAKEGELYEMLSPDVCRVHLSAWKAAGLPSEWLFRMFAASAEMICKDPERLDVYLKTSGTVIQKEKTPIAETEWKLYLKAYESSGMPAVHHSETFRESARPAYRIISSRFLCIVPVLQAAAELVEKQGVKVIALDGRAAAGKTTRAEMLRTVLKGEVIHMDDFFLPPALRNEDRLSSPGGNVHYERFADEVLPFLREKEGFSYRIFDCGRMDYDGRRKVESCTWRIVEGSYSLHPKFGDYADLNVFCDVEEKEQMIRILERNGERMAEMFKNRWIPMEELYFRTYGIQNYADICLMNEKSFCAKLKKFVD